MPKHHRPAPSCGSSPPAPAPAAAYRDRILIRECEVDSKWEVDYLVEVCLEILVEGVETNIPGFKLRFLRRMPQDPFNRDGDDFDQMGWRLRSTTDKPEGNLSWDRKNVFDISSGSPYRALNGSYYKDW